MMDMTFSKPLVCLAFDVAIEARTCQCFALSSGNLSSLCSSNDISVDAVSSACMTTGVGIHSGFMSQFCSLQSSGWVIWFEPVHYQPLLKHSFDETPLTALHSKVYAFANTTVPTDLDQPAQGVQTFKPAVTKCAVEVRPNC